MSALDRIHQDYKQRRAKFFVVEGQSPPPKPPSPRMVDAQRIIDAVAIEFGVGSFEITGPSRVYPVAQARHMAVYLMREMLLLSYPELMEATGRQDHTTAMHSCGLVTERVATCPEYAALVEKLKADIGRAAAVGNGQVTKRVSKGWPEDRVEKLRLLCAQKLSASQIGSQLGCTRNAVIGKCSRLGIKLFGSHGGVRRAKSDRPKQQRKHRFIAFGRADRPLAIRPKPVAAPAPSTEFKVDFFGLTKTTCRFPLFAGDEPIHEKFYCGAASPEGEPYCPWHHNHTHEGFPRHSRPSAASVETKFGLMRAAE